MPLKHVAFKLELPIHERDTFTGFEVRPALSLFPTPARSGRRLTSQLPNHINLVIAVSFGLFVPPRILQAAKYGGLNVHPSFLPE